MKLGKKNAPEAGEPAVEPDATPTANTGSGRGKPGKSHRRLAGIGRLQAAVVVLASALVLALLYYLVWIPMEASREARRTAQGAEQAVARINQRLDVLQALVRGLGQQAVVRQALADRDQLRDTQASLSGLLPEIEEVFLFPYGDIPRSSDSERGLGFASLDLARKAEAGGQIRPDAFPRNDRWFLQMATQVRNPSSQATLGTVLVILRADSLQAAMDIASGGRVALVQTISGESREIAGVGTASGEPLELATAVPQWSLRYTPAPAGAPVVDPLMVLALVLGPALLAAILVWMLLGNAERGLRRDITRLIQWAHKAFAGERGRRPELQWELPAAMGDVLQRLAQGVDKRLDKAAASARGRARETSATTADEPLFQNQDLADIDMLEGDDDVLGLGDAAGSEPAPLVEERAAPAAEVSATIFRAYDIRGVVGETLTPEVVSVIGQAIGTEALARQQGTLCIGFDGRHSSPELADALARGVLSTGCNVIRVGAVPTPVLYFATHHLETGSGVMVTGSHNPPSYNGLKIMLGGETLSGEAIQKLLQRVRTGDFVSGQGNAVDEDVRRPYLDRIVGDIAVAAPLKVVLDAGNGIAGELAPILVEELGCEVVPLYCDVDGNFPNHHPDPGQPDNLADLIDRVKVERADLGIAFDGDGDRIGVVTNSGKIIWPDRLLMLFARDVVSRNPGADVIYDVKCSRRLATVISEAGGRPVMWKSGHSLIKARMQETGALLAGEMSGHIFFRERWYGFDDGLYAAARLLEILGIEDRQSDDIFEEFPEDISTPELTTPAGDDSKFAIVEKLGRLGDFGESNISTIDGIRVEYPDGWGLCRASNTTPALVLRFEAENAAALEHIKAIFRGQLKALAPEVKIDF